MDPISNLGAVKKRTISVGAQIFTRLLDRSFRRSSYSDWTLTAPTYRSYSFRFISSSVGYNMLIQKKFNFYTLQNLLPAL